MTVTKLFCRKPLSRPFPKSESQDADVKRLLKIGNLCNNAKHKEGRVVGQATDVALLELLDDFGLTTSIEWQVKEFIQHTGIACEISSEPVEIVLDHSLSIAVFRICQESLTNITRHAEATSVKIDLKHNLDVFQMRIQDDGKGIEPKLKRKTNSFGLIGMQERVHQFGGVLTVAPGKKKGTIISVTIPIRKKE